MNRFSLIAAAAVLAAAVVGVALFAGGAPNNQPAPTPAAVAATPAPSASTSPSASADAKAPSSLVGTWFGPGRDVPGIVGGSGSRLLITDTGVAFGTPNDQGRPLLSAELAGSVGDTLTVTSGLGSCAETDTGTYQWSLSASGTVLAVTSSGDPCAERASAFEGTWWKAACKIGPTCLGDLEAGTYASQFFRPDHNQASEWGPLFGGIGYTVPEGWANSADWPSRFLLTPSTSYADEDSSGGGPFGVVHEVAVYAKVRQPLCRTDPAASTVDPAAGQTVADLEQWIAGLPDVDTTAAAPITIDGHQGRMLDLRLRPERDHDVPGRGQAVRRAAGRCRRAERRQATAFALFQGERMRLILAGHGRLRPGDRDRRPQRHPRRGSGAVPGTRGRRDARRRVVHLQVARSAPEPARRPRLRLAGVPAVSFAARPRPPAAARFRLSRVPRFDSIGKTPGGPDPWRSMSL